jgi:hypothetical protein
LAVRALSAEGSLEYMSTTPVVSKSQTVCAIERTEKLLHELKQASDFVETKNAIMKYISDIDCQSDMEENPLMLGDADFAHLFIQSLERRDKTPIEKWVPIMIRCAHAVNSLELKLAFETLRTLNGKIGT